MRTFDFQLGFLILKSRPEGGDPLPEFPTSLWSATSTRPRMSFSRRSHSPPVKMIDVAALRTAEKSLSSFDASISVLETASPAFKDILVRVKED
jgi:hypothetical protein